MAQGIIVAGRPRWNRKPAPAYAAIDYGHPMTRQLTAATLMDEAGTRSLIGLTPTLNASTTRVWSQRGSVARWAAGLLATVSLGDSSRILPTSGGTTLFFHYRKTDSTLRVCESIGVDGTVGGGGDGVRCGAHLPFVDGTIYFDYGGTDEGGHRLSVAGLTFKDDLWALTTGARGMEIWQNGTLRASNAANPARSSTSGIFGLGIHGGSSPISDAAESAFLYVWARQLGVGELLELFANPYLILRPPSRRISFAVIVDPMFVLVAN